MKRRYNTAKASLRGVNVDRARSVWLGLIKATGKAEKRPADDPLAALQVIRDAVHTGGKIPQVEASWFVEGLDRLFAGDCRTFDECFQMKPRRGGRFKTPRAVARRAKRDRAVFQLAAPLVGTAWDKAGSLHKIVNGSAPPPSKEARNTLDELGAHDIKLPGTRSGLYQVIVAVTLPYRDM